MVHVHRALALLAVLGLVLSTTAAMAGSDKDAAVNVNTASSVVLQTLPGIGPKKAEAIIDYRTVHGAFKTVDDLILVKGIGPKTLEKLRPLVTVGKASKARTTNLVRLF